MSGGATLTDPEYKRDKEWSRQIVMRYMASFNQPMPDGAIMRNRNNIISENIRYYFGMQNNNTMYFVKQGTPIEALDVTNNQIFKLSNYLKGKIVEIMEKFNISTDVLSETAKNEKDLKRQILTFLATQKDFIEDLATYGIFYAQDQDKALEDKEDVDYYMDNDYRSLGGDIAEQIATEILYNNQYNILKPEQFFDILVAGFCSTDREIVNGRLKEVRVLPQECITDTRNPNDNCYNDAGRFRGRFINLASPYEVLEMYGEHLDANDRNAIEQIAKATDNQYGKNFLANNPASPTGTFNWWEQSVGYGSPITGLSIVKMYWYAERDFRYTYKKGKLVKERDYNSKGEIIEANANRKGVTRNWGVWQAVIIGGRFVCCDGWVNNAVFDDIERGKQALPQTMYIHDYQSGVYTSYISRLRPYQDDIDLAVTKRKLAEINDLGVNYIIWGSEDSTTQMSDILADFKSMHMTMLKVDVDDNGETFKKNFAEVLDFTKSLSVVQIYQAIENDLIQKMSDMVHLPSVLQGTQEQTIGKGVQQATVSLATVGITPLLNGFINYVEKDIRLSSNINKIMFTEGSDYARMIIGDVGVNWLQQSKKETFQNLLIYIHRYDVVDDEAMRRMDADIQPAIQNGLLEFEDILTIRRMTSVRKIYNYVRHRTKKRKKEMEAQRMQQMQHDMQMAQAQSQVSLQGKQIQAQAQIDSADKKKESSMHASNTEAEVKTSNNQRDNQVKLLTKAGGE